MKIHPVGAEFFHEEGQTEEHTHLTELIVAFRNSANPPKEGGKENIDFMSPQQNIS